MPKIEDCTDPVCDDGKEFMKAANSMKSMGQLQKKPAHCPLNKAQLGRNTWSFLHTMAAYYPDKPNDTDKKEMTNFINSFGRFYPCKTCASDFRDDLEYFPPKENVGSRVDLAQYFCMLHNRVNTKLGKDEYDCSIANLDRRWKKNSEEC